MYRLAGIGHIEIMRYEHLLSLNVCTLVTGVLICNAEEALVARVAISAAAKTSLQLALFLENAEVGILCNTSTQSVGDLTNEALRVFQEMQKVKLPQSDGKLC